MVNKTQLRKAIESAFPGLKFRVREVSFMDLARGSTTFVQSDAWGMTIGHHQLYQDVRSVCSKFPGVIVSW